MATSTRPILVFQIKVTLAAVAPPVWRRLAVPSAIALSRLHELLQIAFVWEGYHLHQFTVGREHFGVPSDDDYEEVHDERRVRLEQLLQAPKDKLLYEYDFGDGWSHRVVLEKAYIAEFPHPVCLAGKRARHPRSAAAPGDT